MRNDLRIMACVLCKAPAFQDWVAEQTGAPASEAGAKAFILKKCEVTSRNQLDTDLAAERFHSLVRKPYLASLQLVHAAPQGRCTNHALAYRKSA